MPTKKRTLTGNEKAQIKTLALSIVGDRMRLASLLGFTHGGLRDTYKEFGYKQYLTYADYEGHYRRDGLGKRAINAPAKECWASLPAIMETDSKDTAFEKEWKELSERLGMLDAFSAVDRLCGIGQFAILLLGFNDENASNPIAEVMKATELLYVMYYDEGSTKIVSFEDDRKSPRYGLPLTYEISMGLTPQTSVVTQVHYSRVIHVAEDCLKSRIYGTPRLEAVFNYLSNIDMIAGSSAELWFRNARGGIHLKQDADTADLSEPDKILLKESVEVYQNSLTNYMLHKGIDVQQLSSEVADPTAHISAQIDLIAAGLDMPKRILLGSERGELASSQDERQWAKQMQNRQKRFCEPVILWPFINRLIEKGILAKPKKTLSASWGDILGPTSSEIADVGLKRAQGIAAVESTRQAGGISDELFYDKIMGMTDEEARMEIERLGNLDAAANSPLGGTE